MIQVTIRREDCFDEKGEKRPFSSCENCAAATAMKRTFPGSDITMGVVFVRIDCTIYDLLDPFNYSDFMNLINKDTDFFVTKIIERK